MNIISDQADFVRASLKNVRSSIIEAIIFVLIIVFLFLGNIKATFIPLITIPISLIGSFLFLKIFGFSINIITLLAIVLAIGLVVDDAIVVLENIQRHIDNGLSPLYASMVGAKEISFAIIAMTLTLTSVYIPLAFIKNAIGQLFIEFAVTLAGSVLVSGVVALTLSPLMCSNTLTQHQTHKLQKIEIFLYNLTLHYKNFLDKVLCYKKTCIAVFSISFCFIILLVKSIPNEIIPKEDRNLIGVFIPPTPGKAIDNIEQKVLLVEEKTKNIKEAEHTLAFMGSWGGSIEFPLKPQSARKRSAEEISNSLVPIISQIPSFDAYNWSYNSGLPGIDQSGEGGELALVISAVDNYSNLFNSIENVRKSLESKNIFQRIRHNLRLDTPSYKIDMNTNEMSHLHIIPKQIAKTVEVFFGNNQYLNFSKDGILYNITLKGDQTTWDLNKLYITNKLGKRISLGAI